ncbi:MAG: HAD-IB family phosphatase [Methyloceanibacter sp.]
MSERPKFSAICFDCDGTLTRIEGIDELARRSGQEDAIAPLTAAAMEGSLPLEEVYAKRLAIVRPDRDALAWLGQRYVEEIVDGAVETLATLQRLGKPIYLVSGGLLQAVVTLAQALAIPLSNVCAVEIYLDSDGNYVGFDADSPLARSDGKAAVCRRLAARHGVLAMVGDGMTDLNARAGGAYVVGFGGVTHRPVMAEGADCFIDSMLARTLDVLLTGAELRDAK